MQKVAFLILVTIFFSCSHEKQLKVVTFNVRYHSPNDGVNVWSARIPLIQSFFKKEHFDIIGMQEVTHQQLLDLQKILPDYDYAGLGRGKEREEGEYCPIFYKKQKFTLISKSQFWLSETPEIPGSISWEGTFPRIVTWVKLKNNTTGHIFFVFNTHFCHMSELAREQSAILVMKKIKEIADNAPAVLTGDFNADKTSKSYQLLTTNWDPYISFIDAEDLARKHVNKDSTTFTGFDIASPTIKIDFIFVNGYYSVSKYKIHIEREGDVFISDHYPVSAKLNFLFEKRSRTDDVIKNLW
jgi:endonuclease/exonuclease/phosphatase family metal-dependent hydrolase